MKHEDQEILYAETLLKVHREGGRIVDKKGLLWKSLHVAVIIFTFGTNRNFLKGYYTTIGPWIGVPEGWESRSLAGRIATLEHELCHVKQCAWFGFGNAIIGIPVFSLLYLLFPLPIGLSYFRWRFEREAYAHGINIRIGIEPGRRPDKIDSAVEQLTTGLYGWTWPFKKHVRAWFEEHCTQVYYMIDGIQTRDVQ
jgi:hypothetical protein